MRILQSGALHKSFPTVPQNAMTPWVLNPRRLGHRSTSTSAPVDRPEDSLERPTLGGRQRLGVAPIGVGDDQEGLRVDYWIIDAYSVLLQHFRVQLRPVVCDPLAVRRPRHAEAFGVPG